MTMNSLISKRTATYGPQTLLSIDIGTKNFSYCWLNLDDLTIREWGNTSMSDLVDNPKGLETSKLFQKHGILPVVSEFALSFDSRFNSLLNVTQWIVIEDQLKAQMRVVQGMLYSHLRSRLKNQWGDALLDFSKNGTAVSAKLTKNGLNPSEEFAIIETMHPRVTKKHFGYSELGYGDRKQAATLYTRELFKENLLPTDNWGEHFVSSNKQDDLADSLLQAMCFAHRLKGIEPKKVKCSAIDEKPKISKAQRKRKM